MSPNGDRRRPVLTPERVMFYGRVLFRGGRRDPRGGPRGARRAARLAKVSPLRACGDRRRRRARRNAMVLPICRGATQRRDFPARPRYHRRIPDRRRSTSTSEGQVAMACLAKMATCSSTRRRSTRPRCSTSSLHAGLHDNASPSRCAAWAAASGGRRARRRQWAAPRRARRPEDPTSCKLRSTATTT